MLEKVADGVWVHVSEFIQSNSTVVQGENGLLLVDPGITTTELATLAVDLGELGQPVVAGFATHPDWDHVLWDATFGDAPRYGTARCAAEIQQFVSTTDWQVRLADFLPPEYADEIPMDLLGIITALPVGTTQFPWAGPRIRIIEHQGHAAGHAALFIEDAGVLIAGDMLSDILIPFLDLDAADPIGDYLAALDLFDAIATLVTAVVPGHGSLGGAGRVRERIDQDRRYVEALRDGSDAGDSRIGPDAPLEWLADVHNWQLQKLAGSGEELP